MSSLSRNIERILHVWKCMHWIVCFMLCLNKCQRMLRQEFLKRWTKRILEEMRQRSTWCLVKTARATLVALLCLRLWAWGSWRLNKELKEDTIDCWSLLSVSLFSCRFTSSFFLRLIVNASFLLIFLRWEQLK